MTAHGKLDRGASPAPEGLSYGVRAYEALVGELEQELSRARWSRCAWSAWGAMTILRAGRSDPPSAVELCSGTFVAARGSSVCGSVCASRASCNRRSGRGVCHDGRASIWR